MRGRSKRGSDGKKAKEDEGAETDEESDSLVERRRHRSTVTTAVDKQHNDNDKSRRCYCAKAYNIFVHGGVHSIVRSVSADQMARVYLYTIPRPLRYPIWAFVSALHGHHRRFRLQVAMPIKRQGLVGWSSTPLPTV